jgi:hypothetical protein
MNTCRATGLTANPFANIVEKSISIQRERMLAQSVVNLQIKDTPTTSADISSADANIKQRPPAKRHRAHTISPQNSDASISLSMNTKKVSFSHIQGEEVAMEQGPPNNPDAPYRVIEEAEPAWRSSTSHKGLAQKASLRYDYLKRQLDSNKYPSWTYGLENMPAYLTPMSNEMLTLAKKHAMEMGEQAAIELINIRNNERRLASDHLALTSMMYDRVDNGDFQKAEDRQKQVIGGYRISEVRKLDAYADREGKRRPATDKDLGDLLANRMSRTEKPKRGGNRDNSPANQRAISREPPKKRNKKEPKPCKGGPSAPPPPPPPASGQQGSKQLPSTSDKGKKAPKQKVKSTKGTPSTSQKKANKPGPLKAKPTGSDQLLKLLCQKWLQDSVEKNNWK